MGHVDVVNLASGAVGRGTFKSGWRWSDHVKPIAGTDSCQVQHIGIVLEATSVQMDDGQGIDVGPGDVFTCRPATTPGPSATRTA